MNHTAKMHRLYTAGFTLLEIVMVLMISGLLLGGLIPLLSSQIESQRINETRKQMNEIKEALLGYSVINGKLPCPAPTTDPNNPEYGEAASTCVVPASDGYLPWKALGISDTDAWGGKWLYRVQSNFASSVPFTLTTVSSTLQIENSAGITITSSSERPIAIVFSTGKNLIADGKNADFDATYQSDVPNQNFDDFVTWISKPVLVNRMVAAGKLP